MEIVREMFIEHPSYGGLQAGRGSGAGGSQVCAVVRLIRSDELSLRVMCVSENVTFSYPPGHDNRGAKTLALRGQNHRDPSESRRNTSEGETEEAQSISTTLEAWTKS